MRWMLWDPRWEVEKDEVRVGSVLWEVDETFFQRFLRQRIGGSFRMLVLLSSSVTVKSGFEIVRLPD
jgi:hypothetical protein